MIRDPNRPLLSLLLEKLSLDNEVSYDRDKETVTWTPPGGPLPVQTLVVKVEEIDLERFVGIFGASAQVTWPKESKGAAALNLLIDDWCELAQKSDSTVYVSMAIRGGRIQEDTPDPSADRTAYVNHVTESKVNSAESVDTEWTDGDDSYPPH